MRKREEEEGERRKLYGPDLCCALAQLPLVSFVSILNSRTRIIGFRLAGSLPDRIWCLVLLLAFTLGAVGCDCAVLGLFLHGSTGLRCGHPT